VQNTLGKRGVTVAGVPKSVTSVGDPAARSLRIPKEKQGLCEKSPETPLGLVRIARVFQGLLIGCLFLK
jgi:hypothetical protein